MFCYRYCPKVNAFLTCSDIKSPIQNECFDAEELKGPKVTREINQRLNDFFCKNGSESLIRFIDGKIIECGMERSSELTECYHEYVIAFIQVNKGNLLLSLMPTADTSCK